MLPKNDGSASADSKNKRKMKEVMEEPAATQQPPTNIFSHQQPSVLPFQFNSQQQQQQPPTNIFSLQQPRVLAFQFNSQQQQQQRPTNIFSLQQPPVVPFHFNSQQQQQQPPLEPENQNRFMPRPFTTSLTEEEDNNVPVPLRHMYHQMDQIIQAHSVQLRNMLSEVYRRNYYNLKSAANQEATKKLMEKEEELSQTKRIILEMEQRVSQLNYQSLVMQTRVRDLDRRYTVQDAALRRYAADAAREDYVDSSETEHEDDAESSFVDQNRVQTGNLGTCRACLNAQVAAIIYPCRHLCLCASCAPGINACPVCQTPKLLAYEIFLP